MLLGLTVLASLLWAYVEVGACGGSRRWKHMMGTCEGSHDGVCAGGSTWWSKAAHCTHWLPDSSQGPEDLKGCGPA